MYPADVLPAFVAEMDVALAAPIKRALIDAIERGDTGYAHPAGLADAFADFAHAWFDWTVDSDRVSLVPDVTVGLAEVLRLTTPPGSGVVINTPAYPPFTPTIVEYGRRVVDVPLRRAARGWDLDFDGLERAFLARARAYLLCNPHNPSEELQLGGKLLPSIQSDSAAGLDYFTAVKKVIGAQRTAAFLTVMQVYSPSYPGDPEFVTAYHHVYPGQAPLEFNTNGYDAMNISALAMLEAKSTTPSVWIDKIASLTGNTSLPRVYSFAQGKAAIQASKSVYYFGATGQITFNKYHNSSGNFAATAFNADGSFRQLGTLPAAELQKFVR